MEGKELTKNSKQISKGSSTNNKAVTNCGTVGAPSQGDNGNDGRREDGDSDTESCDERFIERWYGGNALVSMGHNITSLRNSIRSSITKTTALLLVPNRQNREGDLGCEKSDLDRSTARVETLKFQSLVDPLEMEEKDCIFFARTLHPYSIGRALWDLFIVASFLLRFPVTRHSPVFANVGGVVTPVLNGTMKAASLADIFSNLITGYYDHKSLKLVSNQRSIALRYLSGFIFCDAIILFFKYNNAGFGPHFAAILILGFVQLTRIIRALENVNGWLVRQKYCTQAVFEAYTSSFLWVLSTAALLYRSAVQDFVALKIVTTIGIGIHSYMIKAAHDMVQDSKRRNFDFHELQNSLTKEID